MFEPSLSPILRSRLSVPQRRPGVVARPRLFALLEEGCQRALTLICAPAGYGKTTLLVDWVHALRQRGEPPRVGWLTLDAGDNDLLRFLGCLVEALEEILGAAQADRCRAALAGLPLSAGVPEAQALLVALLNALYSQERPLIFILDDYHLVQEAAVHQALQFLIRSLPPNIHLLIAARSDPPLGLAHLRARDQLSEIRLAELAFNLSETGAFLQGSMALLLPAVDVTALYERAEGWPAGIQLAALALRSPLLGGAEGRSAFIRDFSGSQRNILEFLSQEVFDQQPEAVKSFLLCTSLLERLCGPLCDALLHPAQRIPSRDSWIEQTIPPALDAQYFLDWLERNQLFLIPLDAEQHWFRYHPLFADLLRSRLKRQHPGLARILLSRAALWSEAQGLLLDAFAQAQAAEDAELCAGLYERHILEFFFQSEIAQVQRWLAALPEELLRCRPLLCAVYAAALALLPPFPPLSLARAEPWMDLAEQASLDAEEENLSLARAFAATIRSYWARFRDEPPETVLTQIERAQAALAQGGARRELGFVRSSLHTNLALALWQKGDEPAAQQALVEARALSAASGDMFNESATASYLMRIAFLHGDLERAESLGHEALAALAQRRVQGRLPRRAPFSAEIGVQLADIFLEQDRLAESRAQLEENLALARWTMSHNILLRGLLTQARLAWADGDLHAAHDYINEAARLSEEGAAQAGALRVRAWLASGAEAELRLAQDWAQRAGDQPLVDFANGPPRMTWSIALAYARVQIASGDRGMLQSMLGWLERQADALAARGWAHWELAVRLAEFQARQKLGDSPAAQAALRRAMFLARPGGYLRCFVEEGAALREEIQRVAGPAPDPFLRRLLAAFPAAPAQDRLPIPARIEPLTPREEEVLHLVCAGCSNQEIAARLVLTLNTVKKHNYAIFQKLGVNNRAQAIVKAREWGW